MSRCTDFYVDFTEKKQYNHKWRRETMRTLKYVIMGLLNQTGMSGYDIAAQLNGALKEFWSANHSQIYPELKKLSDEGLVEYSVEISGSVLERKVYSLTDAGRKEFLDWLNREEPMMPTPKDVFRLRLFFANEMLPGSCTSLLKHELEQHRLRLANLKYMNERFDGVPEQTSPKFGDYLVLLGAIMREETSCAWLEKCLDIVNKK